MAAYYNERDPFAAQWLRNLAAAGHIAPGEVDERDVWEIRPDDLRGFTQCHFFAGIGGWSYALRRAGWPDELPAWTGSCPCQPFSAAGRQKGFADERHLWPAWSFLIRECRPAIVLGEQVASALAWLDLVSADLEGAGYAFAASDLCAAGFDGAHIRQRLYFAAVAVAYTHDARSQGRLRVPERADERTARARGMAGRMGDAVRPARGRGARAIPGAQAALDGTGLGFDGGLTHGPGGLAEPDSGKRERFADGQGGELDRQAPGWQQGDGSLAACGEPRRADAPMLGRQAADWLFCRDGKWRPVEPGTFPLADAIPGRVGRLRAYGNALDAETASQFCGAVAEALVALSDGAAVG